jgi:hypothetical protein
MIGKHSEPNYPHEEEEGKKVFWYYDNIDDEVTPEVPFSKSSNNIQLIRSSSSANSYQHTAAYQMTRFFPTYMR